MLNYLRLVLNQELPCKLTCVNPQIFVTLKQCLVHLSNWVKAVDVWWIKNVKEQISFSIMQWPTSISFGQLNMPEGTKTFYKLSDDGIFSFMYCWSVLYPTKQFLDELHLNNGILNPYRRYSEILSKVFHKCQYLMDYVFI